MADEQKPVSDNPELSGGQQIQPGLDEASQSLTNALRMSFKILAVLILFLVVVFVGKGFETVGPDEKALVLRFGEATDVLPTGLHYTLPYPIHEVVRIKTNPKTIRMDTFWPKISEQEKKDIMEGKKEMPKEVVLGAAGGFHLTGDLNILESRWTIVYKVKEDQASITNYYNTFGSDSGQEELLVQMALESAILHEISRFEVFDAYVKKKDLLNENVRRRLRATLDTLDCGLEVSRVELLTIRPPQDVKPAFDNVLNAHQQVNQMVQEAEKERSKALIEAAGENGEKLGDALTAWWSAKEAGDSAAMSKQEVVIDALFKEARGKVEVTMAGARAYKTKLIQEAKADSEKLRKWVEGNEPETVQMFVKVERIAALREALSKAMEVFWVGASGDNENSELELIIKRRPDVLAEIKEYKQTR